MGEVAAQLTERVPLTLGEVAAQLTERVDRIPRKSVGEGKMEKPMRKNNNLLNNAKCLRRNMTRQEKHLWYDFLQQYPAKIYKQRIIDSFIADFYCHKARLVIELDGSQHYTLEGKSYDEARSEVLERYGLYVLRFSNKDIDERFDAVCRMIDNVIQERLEIQ